MKFQGFKSSQGYTLFEALTIVAVLGILSAIATPSWLAFLTKLRLNAAQSQALAVMREAQAGAKREKRVWEACFQQNETEKKVKWSVHPFKENGEICENARWQNLIGSDADKIAINMSGSSRSTLDNKSNIYRVQFNHKGRANGRTGLGKITFIPRNQSNGLRRCVWASTLLGALRTSQEGGCDDD